MYKRVTFLVQRKNVIPYAGRQGEKVLNKLKQQIPEKIRPKVIYKGRKLSSFFPVKDKIDKMHSSNVVYYYKSDLPNIVDDYTGETKCRLGKRMKEHLGSDKESAIVKNFLIKGIPPRSEEEFSILATNYPNHLKRKTAESLFVKENKSILNIQKDTFKLNLFI